MSYFYSNFNASGNDEHSNMFLNYEFFQDPNVSELNSLINDVNVNAISQLQRNIGTTFSEF